jgi:hypothetical protein
MNPLFRDLEASHVPVLALFQNRSCTRLNAECARLGCRARWSIGSLYEAALDAR